ncbi:MAG: RimK family alpha-L-glutamate ligase [Bdellovibrionaceae bacterium]|nr:RimK family alpha-L-glutamate ligase [Bacteriovoracaceae bacterium]MCK6598205.1 RimK family alpha-L-glutamate ligase [Pseudobdellovibrionaceae bacterium]NUM58423.1 RimK family alpha-L-glutamate ligase [Pseudobdellovibrionaceae bacterium]
MNPFIIITFLPHLESNQKFKLASAEFKNEIIFINPFELNQKFIDSYPDSKYFIRIGDYRYKEVISHLKKFPITYINPLNQFVIFRSKALTFQFFWKHHFPTPSTLLVSENNSKVLTEIQKALPFPMVGKLSESSKGNGVFLVSNNEELKYFLETHMQTHQVLLQEFIVKSAGKDVRVFITENELLSIERQNATDFRSNLNQGGKAIATSLNPKELELCIKLFKLTGLKYAGIDFLRTDHGPLFLEVNVSPGFKGIDDVYGKDMARRILEIKGSR